MILKKLNPQVVIFEEAAEVLEAHIVTSLTESVEHVILIGDHQQLKPNPTVYDLSKKFHFDISLFERMIKNGVECHTLSIQHRMRPTIASLLVPHIYNNLQNHPIVSEYENVRGIKSNVFFINHNCHEEEDMSLRSHVNLHEGRFLMELCQYLLSQDYKPCQITILTTYSGQLQAMKKLFKQNEKKFSEIKIAVVDNYQGEQNDIILVSFVRCNDEGKIGFLSISNRVCVALSRARKGLYCIGNFEGMTKNNNIWKNVLDVLQSQNNIGEALRLCCYNHPETFNDVSSDKDFLKIPNGVCSLICNKLLHCGHKCVKYCHVIDPEHLEPCKIVMTKELPLCSHRVEMQCCENPNDRKCPHLCLEELPCGHKCKLHCTEPCTKNCMEMVSVQSICNHILIVECFIKSDLYKVRDQCKAQCETVYECSHTCPFPCGQPCLKQCEFEIQVPSSCGHDVNIKCFTRNDPVAIQKQCKVPCQKMLKCGHKCPLLCGEVCEQQCQFVVSASSYCGHEVIAKCFDRSNSFRIRDLCDSKCEKTLECGHRCQGLCNEQCTKECEFKVPVSPSCGHYFIAACYEKSRFQSDDYQCKKPCEKILDCGHICKLKCGEVCVCEEIIHILSTCGHLVYTQCFLISDPAEVQKFCMRPCGKTLECGHRCSLRCGLPCTEKCENNVRVELDCGHTLTRKCFQTAINKNYNGQWQSFESSSCRICGVTQLQQKIDKLYLSSTTSSSSSDAFSD